MQAVRDAGGNKTVAAARLGVSRKTVHEYTKDVDTTRGLAPPV
jgi:DNA-binding NtrC family response regulator